jgi:hypothetical protein
VGATTTMVPIATAVLAFGQAGLRTLVHPRLTDTSAGVGAASSGAAEAVAFCRAARALRSEMVEERRMEQLHGAGAVVSGDGAAAAR